MDYNGKLNNIEQQLNEIKNSLKADQKRSRIKELIPLFSLILVLLTSLGGWYISYMQMSQNTENIKFQVTYETKLEQYREFLILANKNWKVPNYLILKIFTRNGIDTDSLRHEHTKWMSALNLKSKEIVLYFRDIDEDQLMNYSNLVDELNIVTLGIVYDENIYPEKLDSLMRKYNVVTKVSQLDSDENYRTVRNLPSLQQKIVSELKNETKDYLGLKF